jgi:hypothetical protein
MTSKSVPRGLLAIVGAGAIGAACGSPSEPHGSPVLTAVYWSANGTQQIVWSPTNVPMPTSVSPFADEIDFVFDRRLDGSRIEDIVTTNGVPVPVPKTPAAIAATWPDMAKRMSDPPFDLVVDYNSVPLFGGQSAYVLARPQLPGFPSADTITFDLLLSSLTSAYGDLATVPAPGTIAVKTMSFAVSIVAPASAVATNYQLPLTFSNRLPPVGAAGESPAIHVTLAGAAVPYKLLADASLLSRWYVAPADCLGAWPANSTLTVSIDVGLPDAFGSPLAAGATATFATGARSGVPADASCSVADAGDIADGPPDGGVGDAASDGGALDAGPPEGGTDAGASTSARAGGKSSDASSDASSGDATDVPVTFDAAAETSSGAG